MTNERMVAPTSACDRKNVSEVNDFKSEDAKRHSRGAKLKPSASLICISFSFAEVKAK